ncbi:MAG: outer membrane protein assembly factor [Candidatus Nitrohelix vancouverensis]|uniref:Outer membrane protein assembly factor n=1 Tax=Candidatus Nitrohelix vancouverensis TaxID=2705534 RepID=A0A7T0C3F1_9BACT|nr:MAG: outer membrane protein assembly factor [Candidatus Nitrohelix vancouverensis]
MSNLRDSIKSFERSKTYGSFQFTSIRYLLLLALVWLGLCLTPLISHAADYQVSLQAIEDGKLKETLELSSNLFQLQKAPPSTLTALVRRASSDRIRLRKVLKAFGFLAGDVAVTINGNNLDSIDTTRMNEQAPFVVELKIATGPLYSFGEIQIQGIENLEIAAPLRSGEPALASHVVDGENQIVRELNNLGYPKARISNRELRINHQKQTLEPSFTVDTGPRVQMGDLIVKGNQNTRTEFITERKTWETGDLYNPEKLQKFRSDLLGLDIFSSARLDLEEIPATDKASDQYQSPITLGLEEKPARFFGFGADATTTEGSSVRAFWGHRNFLGGGEKFRITGRVSRIGKNDFDQINNYLESNLFVPDWLDRHQNLIMNSSLENEHFDAFDRKAFTGFAGLERKFTQALSLKGGLQGEVSNVENQDGQEDFVLMGFPVDLKYDTRDDLLDPRSGVSNQLSVAPYLTLVGSGVGFTKTRISGKAYHSLDDKGHFVLAGRAVIGGISGNTLTEIPSDKRFFAGGGGSIRGYEFQSVGPLESNGDPEGGRSLLEVGLELRMRYKDFGIVPFIDGGNVFTSDWPDLDEDLQWGAGLGLRYYTPVGPVRLDVAFPVNRRPEVDDSIAFYISIGQTF